MIYPASDASAVSWTDIGSFATGIATLLVLATAAIFAGWQVWEARRFREAQFRPFVILDFSTFHGFVELTIKNIGATLARDVKFTFDPALKTTMDDDPRIGVLADAYIFREGIPSLPPGKELSMVFDKGDEMTKAGLPDRYEVTATYRGDPLGREYKDPPLVLDLGIYRDRGPIHRHGLHEIHALLEKRIPAVVECGLSGSLVSPDYPLKSSIEALLNRFASVPGITRLHPGRPLVSVGIADGDLLLVPGPITGSRARSDALPGSDPHPVVVVVPLVRADEDFDRVR